MAAVLDKGMKPMKAVFTKSLVVLAGAVLVVPFVAVALFVGAQAAGATGGADERLVLAALAIGGAILGGVKGLNGQDDAARDGHVRRARNRARRTSPTLS
jgi:hypothetical protein